MFWQQYVLSVVVVFVRSVDGGVWCWQRFLCEWRVPAVVVPCYSSVLWPRLYHWRLPSVVQRSGPVLVDRVVVQPRTAGRHSLQHGRRHMLARSVYVVVAHQHQHHHVCVDEHSLAHDMPMYGECHPLGELRWHVWRAVGGVQRFVLCVERCAAVDLAVVSAGCQLLPVLVAVLVVVVVLSVV